MFSTGNNSHADARSAVLPLFRPEVLAAQEKIHGQILLIRPFSLMFLTFLLLAIAAAGLIFLFSAHYEETTAVTASLRSASAPAPEAAFVIPASWTGSMHPGSSLSMIWQSSCAPPQRLTGLISRIAPAPSAVPHANLGIITAGSAEVTINLPGSFALRPNTGGTLQAEIPRGRRRLIHWFFSRNST